LLVTRPDFIIVQNPPAVPTLMLAQFICLLRGSKLIIDWHNFGYTILQLSVGPGMAVNIAKWYEKKFGHYAYAHLCVTKAMATELRNVWNVKGKVYTLYDHAPKHFCRLSLADIHQLLLRLDLESGLIHAKDPNNEYWKSLSSRKQDCTILTERVKKTVKFISNRPALIVSSTSWTADEDFGIMFAAIKEYDNRACERHDLPHLLFVITGKGPMKTYYEQKIKKTKLTKVRVMTMWLESKDYPLLLGAADLGISLHCSSSGLDLPMKVVDMYGCGLPVISHSYECIKELVKSGKTGLLFKNAGELSNALIYMFEGFPEKQDKLDRMHKNVVEAHERRWPENWDEIILPVIN